MSSASSLFGGVNISYERPSGRPGTAPGEVENTPLWLSVVPSSFDATKRYSYVVLGERPPACTFTLTPVSPEPMSAAGIGALTAGSVPPHDSPTLANAAAERYSKL